MMDRLRHKKISNRRRAGRVRAVIKKTADRPRLSIHITNLNVSAQIVDLQSGRTLVYITSATKTGPNGNLTEKATWVGQQIAASAKKAKINEVVFDRGGKKYHGRIAALAEAARAGGMEF